MSTFWGYFGIVLIGIVLVGLFGILIRYHWEIQIARKKIESLGSQVIETVFGQVEYIQVGTGYPVLVVHGAFGGFDQGLSIAKSLSFPNCQIISVSRFGHLRSSLPQNADLNMQADAYASLLDVLKIKQAVVFAISAGSTSAIRFAARHPERVSAMILFGPDAPGKTEISIPPRFIFDILFRSNFFYWILITYFRKNMQNMMGLVPNGFIPTPEHSERINQILKGDLPIDRRMDGFIFETYTTASELLNSITDSSPYPLGNIKTPVLIVNALDDPITTKENVQNLAVKFSNRYQYLVPDGGHLFFNHENEVKTEIIRFLTSTLPELNEKN